mmetsp:Transcript_23089/g.41619  ORF Transcript_23089/g.41619 Transcript_23089/m.41619 type:complete len:227 (+) Transcript_23089:1296-1976(+)
MMHIMKHDTWHPDFFFSVTISSLGSSSSLGVLGICGLSSAAVRTVVLLGVFPLLMATLRLFFSIGLLRIGLCSMAVFLLPFLSPGLILSDDTLLDLLSTGVAVFLSSAAQYGSFSIALFLLLSVSPRLILSNDALLDPPVCVFRLSVFLQFPNNRSRSSSVGSVSLASPKFIESDLRIVVSSSDVGREESISPIEQECRLLPFHSCNNSFFVFSPSFNEASNELRL